MECHVGFVEAVIIFMFVDLTREAGKVGGVVALTLRLCSELLMHLFCFLASVFRHKILHGLAKLAFVA